MWAGENGLKHLKGGGTEKRGGETKILKMGEAGSRGGCLKKGGGGWNSLWNYDSFFIAFFPPFFFGIPEAARVA